ncbi:MAG: hypothetical protein WCV88_02905 [Patescibacteria group bacterium]|jgi:ribosomal protein L35
MKKLKTIKSISKRIKVSGGKKKRLILRTPGQDHFNSRESGKTTRNKRRDFEISKVFHRTIRRSLTQ